jgi:hypothetical protein
MLHFKSIIIFLFFGITFQTLSQKDNILKKVVVDTINFQNEQLKAAKIAKDTIIPYQMGKPTIEELTMKFYEQDTSAVALKMIDFAHQSLSISSRIKHYQRFKIFKKQGYEYATFKIPFYAPEFKNNNYSISDDHIWVSFGYVYNLENGVIKIDTFKNKKDIFIEDLKDGWKMMRFTLPNVKEGSVFEVEYTHNSPTSKNFKGWVFQDKIPVAWSDYELSYPKGMATFKVLTQTTYPFVFREDYLTNSFFSQEENHRWAMRNVPAIQEEPYISSIDNYTSKIEFELATLVINGSTIFKNETWDDVTKKLNKDDDFGKDIKNFGKLKEVAKGILDTREGELKLAEKAYQHIRNRFLWDGKESLYTSQKLKKSYETGLGNSSDINLSLVVLLRYMDLKANPLILCTRNNGRNYDQPFLTKINYALAHVKINGKDYLLDATERFGTFGVLPIRCLNGRGYLLDGKDSRWIEINTSEAVRSFIKVETEIDATEGHHKGSMLFSGTGYYAGMMRASIKEETPQKFKESFIKAHTELQTPKVTLKNIEADSMDAPEIYCEAATTEGIQSAGNRMYLGLFITGGLKENPFHAEKRNFPIDFSVPYEDTYIGSYTLPKGYEIEEMPKSNVFVSLDNALKYTISVSLEGNKVSVYSRLLVRKPIFSTDEYANLREFYSKVVAKQAEKIVLKKK